MLINFEFIFMTTLVKLLVYNTKIFKYISILLNVFKSFLNVIYRLLYYGTYKVVVLYNSCSII